MQAQQNIETLNNYDIVHHSVFIDSLIASGKLTLPEGFESRKLTYHDPCYMGCYNDVYDEPRPPSIALASPRCAGTAPGASAVVAVGDAPGAWMEEKIGKRINQVRVNEALETHTEVLGAVCPFCITMFEDGIKGVEAEEQIKMADIAEILARDDYEAEGDDPRLRLP